MLYQQRYADNEMRMGERDAASRDYHMAAYYYEQALLRPDCPTYLERFPAYMYGNAETDQAAYASWSALWERLTPEERELKEHDKAKLEEEIRKLEQKLSIPREKRIFPQLDALH